MKITMVISSLSSGGAERVMSSMANYWAEKGWEITIITFGTKDKDFYPLHEKVQRVELDLLRNSKNILESIKGLATRIVRLRKEILKTRPQIVISFMDLTNITTLIALRGTHIPIIVSERTDPTQQKLHYIYEKLRKIVYPYSSQLVVQTKRVYDWATHITDLNKISIIANPISKFFFGEFPSNDLNKENAIIALGRLSYEKGFDILIRAFSQCQRKEGWSLKIVGEGPEEQKLKQMARDLGMEKKIIFTGRVNNPKYHLQTSKIFVLSSRYEGFPNALLEAMACGLPVISTDCPSGPSEIILPGVNGLLVKNKDEKSLSLAIDYLIANENQRKQLGRSARAKCHEYKLENIMEAWENIIYKCIYTR